MQPPLHRMAGKAEAGGMKAKSLPKKAF